MILEKLRFKVLFVFFILTTISITEKADATEFGALAIGVPGEDIEQFIYAGAVNILYAQENGFSSTRNQHINSYSLKNGLTPDNSESFGETLAVGDFDGDGHFDLSIGTPFANIPNVNGKMHAVGMVNVIYGATYGLNVLKNQKWLQGGKLHNWIEAGDRFGRSLASDDFNNDGYSDLAIGVTLENLNGFGDVGAVHIIYGSSKGLVSDGTQFLSQVHPDIAGDPHLNEHFGQSLTTGDFNNDGYADLAIGVNDIIDDKFHSGGVNIFYGGEKGLNIDGNHLINQDSPGMPGNSEISDRFGNSLTSADFNGDGYDDLAIGSYFKKIDGIERAGSVYVVHGSATGLNTNLSQQWHQNSQDILGDCHSLDDFGHSLKGGDFNNDGFDDLAIGIWGERVGEIEGAGGVAIIYGSSVGLIASGNQLWNQNSEGVIGRSDINEHFGVALEAGDFNNDGIEDLAIGSFNHILYKPNAGAVSILFGSQAGLTSDKNEQWDLDSPGIAGIPWGESMFGKSLAYIPPSTAIKVFPWNIYMPVLTDNSDEH